MHLADVCKQPLHEVAPEMVGLTSPKGLTFVLGVVAIRLSLAAGSLVEPQLPNM